MTVTYALDEPFINPPSDSPFIPDTTTGKRWTFDANTLQLSDGQTLGSWIGEGPAPLAERTLSAKPTNWDLPTLSATGGPSGSKCVAFNKNQQIRMAANAAPTINQPMTLELVFKINDYNGSTFTRLWGGSSSGVLSVGASGGTLRMLGSNNVPIGIAPDGHTIGIFVFNGSESFAVINGFVSEKLNIGTGYYNGGGFGGSTNSSALPGSGLDGEITLGGQYDRAFSLVDAQSRVAELALRFGT